jgi:hypothetical protein
MPEASGVGWMRELSSTHIEHSRADNESDSLPDGLDGKTLVRLFVLQCFKSPQNFFNGPNTISG